MVGYVLLAFNMRSERQPLLQVGFSPIGRWSTGAPFWLETKKMAMFRRSAPG
jgi:hypothetical protein